MQFDVASVGETLRKCWKILDKKRRRRRSSAKREGNYKKCEYNSTGEFKRSCSLVRLAMLKSFIFSRTHTQFERESKETQKETEREAERHADSEKWEVGGCWIIAVTLRTMAAKSFQPSTRPLCDGQRIIARQAGNHSCFPVASRTDLRCIAPSRSLSKSHSSLSQSIPSWGSASYGHRTFFIARAGTSNWQLSNFCSTHF